MTSLKLEMIRNNMITEQDAIKAVIELSKMMSGNYGDCDFFIYNLENIFKDEIVHVIISNSMIAGFQFLHGIIEYDYGCNRNILKFYSDNKEMTEKEAFLLFVRINNLCKYWTEQI